MSKSIIYSILGILAILAIAIYHVPGLWIFLAVVVFLLAKTFNPFRLSVETIPEGFIEKKFDTGGVVLNYVEGPDNGPPLLFIPGQMEFWQGYMPVMPHFSKRYHVFAIDLRGHGKSTRTPGKYSYNICGEDLKLFLEKVIKKPAIVSGLSSGAVLSLWLAANAPEYVSAAISEDPPLFSSMYPRIKEEKFMCRLFQTAIETLDKPKRDIKGFFAKQGIPIKGKEKLLLMPSFIASYRAMSLEINKKLRPSKPYDLLNARFDERAGLKFISEYDVDFSKATIDGRLSEGFDPEETLKKIKCPVLLICAYWSRHETWGLLGALDDKDVEKIRSIVKDVQVVKVNAMHDVHLAKPKLFIEVVDEYLSNFNKIN
ncbi:MAG: alpha/beta hydrolase [Patescibacteria group bacterium]|nr:alpha/beta hydrolase [Patescibacteria group bacterium]MDD5120988.1 alpha/beta hydrolase [Patescibacteria group bacterium]MDD5222136.1 alpha/beta hydrolase [Patescibacteria group bacterium]MDD5396093.1 alpha/beta hydrolase [Patescibacteria group bacterium]